MARTKTANKKRRRKVVDADPTSARRQEDKKHQPITAVFKGEEIQEIATILEVTEPDDSQTLLGAVVLNKFDVVKKLLKDGFSIDSCKEDGITPLMWVIRLKQWGMTEFLVKRGASLNLEDENGSTPIMIAACSESWTQDLFIDLWNLVKDFGVNINHKNKTGNTMLHLVVKRNWSTAVDLITMDGANPNIANNRGVTPIMLACSKHQMSIIETLLTHAADLSIEDQKGCTACCYAVAYMIQKRIVTLDFATEEVISFMRSNNTKMSIKSYLKRRLELLQNPPEENFGKTISAVIVHVITFFLRFVTEGIAILLQLNVFKSIRYAIEKHIEDNDYIIALLKIVTELVRYCDCCTPHIPWDSVTFAFNEAGMPCICLHLQERLENSSSLHAAFLPLFLTCKHPATKLWLQKNFNSLSQYYRKYIQTQDVHPKYNFYPDEIHSQMVRKVSLIFKQLTGQLQRGNVIQQEKRQSKKKKKKAFNKKKTIQRNLNFLKKNDAKSEKTSSIEVEDDKNQLNNKENIIVAVISNKKKDEVQINNEEEKTPETYWSLDKINQIDEQIVESKSENEESDDQTIYPKWKEDFKEGCQLFGVTLDEKNCKLEQEIGNDVAIPQVSVSFKEMGTKISESEKLFYTLLNIYEETLQQDFSWGHKNLELMQTLPNIELFDLSQVVEKWKELCGFFKMKWTKTGDEIIPDIKTGLVIPTEGNEILATSVLWFKETIQQNRKSVISIEQFLYECREKMHSKIKRENGLSNDIDRNQEKFAAGDMNQINKVGNENNVTPDEDSECQLSSLKKYLQKHNFTHQFQSEQTKIQSQQKFDSIDNVSDNIIVLEGLVTETACLHSEQEEEIGLETCHNNGLIEKDLFPTNNEILADSTPLKNFCRKINNLQATYKQAVDDTLEILKDTSASTKVHLLPPPGFLKTNEVSEFKEIHQEKWRQTDFVINRYPKHISFLRSTRSLLVKDLVVPPPHMQMYFIVGHGGSFGPVTFALDFNSGKPVVIKRLAQNESIQSKMRAWTIHGLMRRLMHVHSKFLVPYSHCINTKQFIFLASPLCQRNINEHIVFLKGASSFTMERAKSLVRQVMAGLNYLHSQNPPIIHGNLKPTNLLIDAAGNVRLSDFGIHEILHQNICASLKSAVWWSRETYRHYHIDCKIMVTYSSDVQVLGMLTHYILTGGTHPFGRTPKEIVKSVTHGCPVLRLNSHEALDIVSWMLCAVPEERPTTYEIMKHVFNWDKNKKWKFLLLCAGVTTEGVSLSFVLENFHYSIDKYARECNIDTKLAQIATKQLDPKIWKSKYSETLSGLLNLLRDNLPSSAGWFLSIFPSLPLILCRLLENSPWFCHPDLAQFQLSRGMNDLGVPTAQGQNSHSYKL